MKRKRKKTKIKKTVKWYLDRILRVTAAALVITGAVLLICGSVQDSMALILTGIAMLPGFGILITPNIVLYAFKDNVNWKSKFREKRDKLYKAGLLGTVDDMSPYHSKLLWGVRREALLNLFVLLLVVVGIVAVRIILLVNDIVGESEADFFIILAALTFGIPILAYNIAGSAYRIRTVKRREYNAYRTVVTGADGLNMWIMDEKENITSFDYCRCLGIRSKQVHNTKAVIVFVPDEVYIIPEKE